LITVEKRPRERYRDPHTRGPASHEESTHCSKPAESALVVQEKSGAQGYVEISLPTWESLHCAAGGALMGIRRRPRVALCRHLIRSPVRSRSTACRDRNNPW